MNSLRFSADGREHSEFKGSFSEAHTSPVAVWESSGNELLMLVAATEGSQGKEVVGQRLNRAGKHGKRMQDL